MKFQIIENADLTQIFPTISNDIYELISGKIINLTTSEANQLKKTGSINYGGVTISKDLLNADVSKSGVSPIVSVAESIKHELSKTTLFMGELVDAICHGIDLGQHIMLYGKGGHNKSEGTLAVLNLLNEKGVISTNKPFIKSLGDGTTVEDLLGGVKFKLMTEEGKIEYEVLNSFMNHEIVIFEECFDAPSAVLLVLKDIMTSGKFRNGNQVFDIKCKTIIALTNRTKDEISMDDSIEALAQRFSVTAKIEWDRNEYKASNFVKLFEMTRPKEVFNKQKSKLRIFAKMCEGTIDTGNSFISPRSAVKGSFLFCNGAPLSLISDLDPKVVKDVMRDSANELEAEESQQQLISLEDYCNKNKLFETVNKAQALLKLTTNNDAEGAKKMKIRFVMNLIQNMTWHSSYTPKTVDLINRLREVEKQLL